MKPQQLEPSLPSWQRHLREEMLGRGHSIEVRRNRNGSLKWRIDGGRELPTGPASRKMEIAIYGRANP
jgi:hypothetical protein